MPISDKLHLEYIVDQVIEHHHIKQAHQSLDNEIIKPPPTGPVKLSAKSGLVGS
jgi:hypothetical protein